MAKIKKDVLKKIQKILHNQKNELLHKPVITHEVDFDGDEMDEIQATLIASINSQLSIMEKQKLLQIETAILKIKNGTFGKCDICEEYISSGRLLASPIFTNCIDCAENIELEEKKNRGF